MREQQLKRGSRTRIKICGLTRLEDIQAVNEAKPDFAGFIVEFSKSRRNVTVEQLRALREKLDESILPVGVFVNAPVELPAQLLNEGTIALAQLHGQEDENYIRQLRIMTDQLLIKAFSIKTEADIKKAIRSEADYILLDRQEEQEKFSTGAWCRRSNVPGFWQEVWAVKIWNQPYICFTPGQ